MAASDLRISDMDNSGIYILRLKGEYRVTYIPNIENLNWSFLSLTVEKTFIPTRIYEWYTNCDGCGGYKDAIKTAIDVKRRCKSKIFIIQVNKTWQEITEEARCLAEKELEVLRKINDGRWDSAVENLLHIIKEKNG